MHGVTKPVTLELTFRGLIENPMNKKQIAGFRATGTVKRADFALGTKFAPPMLSEEVTIIEDGSFYKKGQTDTVHPSLAAILRAKGLVAPKKEGKE